MCERASGESFFKWAVRAMSEKPLPLLTVVMLGACGVLYTDMRQASNAQTDVARQTAVYIAQQTEVQREQTSATRELATKVEQVVSKIDK